jgi:hypothetical protein
MDLAVGIDDQRMTTSAFDSLYFPPKATHKKPELMYWFGAGIYNPEIH